ncbi:MAG: hypothetical protein RI973_203 [Bacteroidota bacterium]|jgi:hypothetical protein
MFPACRKHQIKTTAAMNLQKLSEAIAAYANFLIANPGYNPYWKWEVPLHFQENWDEEAADFKGMYERCLQNATSRRLWKRENYEPRDMMLKFSALNSEFVRYAFKDLFNESREVEGRADRFVFHCDELLREYKETHPRSVDNSHYHDDDYQMVSLYLSWRYPAQYAPYDFDSFRKLMQLLGARDVPRVNDIDRYFKVMRTLYKFLQKDEKALKIHRQRLKPSLHFTGETLLAAEDFMRVVTN